MKKQVDEHIEKVIKAVDVAVWAYAVKSQTKRGNKITVDFQGAMKDLTDAYNSLELSQYEVVLSENQEAYADNTEHGEHVAPIKDPEASLKAE